MKKIVLLGDSIRMIGYGTIIQEYLPKDLEVWQEYEKIVSKEDDNVRIEMLERFAFYERAKKAYVVIATGEERTYTNIVLKKGVIK
ncbi:MAG: RbsD/FucU domain-containing protein [Bacilli bacterium]|jgi:L-fucose mutarotase/ribose pyranase (RbsD/FucU family)